jgi:hypothetical protein
MLENNWIKYYLKETDSDKSLEQVVQYLNDSKESFKSLAIRSFMSKLQLDDIAAKQEYEKLRKKYILRHVGKLGILVFLISIPAIIIYWTKLFPPQSHVEILSEYLHGHFDKDHKAVNKHHANNIEKYWDLIEPHKDSITNRNNSVWDNTGDSMLQIDTILNVDSPIYYIRYKAFKDSNNIKLKKQRCLRIKFDEKKIIEVGPCEGNLEKRIVQSPEVKSKIIPKNPTNTNLVLRKKKGSVSEKKITNTSTTQKKKKPKLKASVKQKIKSKNKPLLKPEKNPKAKKIPQPPVDCMVE